MARFEFLREGRVWLEYDNTFYLLHTARDVTFNQTFEEKGVPRRTLQQQTNFVQGSSITQANPADFSFTLYLLDGESSFKHQHKPLDLLLNMNATPEGVNNFNLYFVYSDYSPETYYKLERCVFTSGSFKIPRNGLMTVNLSGTGSKLSRAESSFSQSPHSNYTASPSYAISKEFDIEFKPLLSYTKQDRILGATIEVQNNVSWTTNSTLQESLSVTAEFNTIFPYNYTLSDRNIGGSIQQYTDGEVNNSGGSQTYIQSWRDIGIRISAGLASNNLQLLITLPDARSTTRTTFGEVFTQNYDFRAIEDTSTFVYN